MLGTGLIKGMVETARNFAGSYVSDERLTTLQYPEERDTPKENTRQFPFLVFDGDDWEKGMRCVACQICEKECPPQCIYITKSKDKKPDHVGKAQIYPAVFDIDISVCMSCQICVEVCPFEAIKMDQEFELSNTDRFGGLLLNKQQLSRPNSHFQHLHPTDAAEIDARRGTEVAKAKADAEAKAKAAAAAKAAPASPTAPVGSVATKPAAPAPAASAPAAPTPASTTAPPAPSAPEAAKP